MVTMALLRRLGGGRTLVTPVEPCVGEGFATLPEAFVGPLAAGGLLRIVKFEVNGSVVLVLEAVPGDVLAVDVVLVPLLQASIGIK